MKKFLVVLALTACGGEAVDSRLEWDTYFLGKSLGRTLPIGNPFTADSSSDGALSYRSSDWSLGGLTCSISGAGASNPGDTLLLDVVDENGNVECRCDLGRGIYEGKSSCEGNDQFECHCGDSAPLKLTGKQWRVEISKDSSCLRMPGQDADGSESGASIFCSADLFHG